MVVRSKRIDIPNVTLLEMLANTAERHPAHIATIFGGQEQTYEQLYHAVLSFMWRLQREGVQTGDRVGIMLPNCPQYIIAYYAVVGIGGVVVQMNPMSPAPELECFIQDSTPTVLVVYDKLLPVVKEATSYRKVINKTVVVRLESSDASVEAGQVWMDEWIQNTPTAVQLPGFSPDTAAVLQYTGGTTGRPKGAMLTHSNLVANAYQMVASYPGGCSVQDMMLCALPFFHVYAMTVCMNLAVLVGMPMLIVPRFQPALLLELIREYRPTLFPAVPTMYVALTQTVPPGANDLQCLRVCNSGGAPMPQHVMLEFERVSGAIVLEGYGLSETSPVTHFNTSVENRKVGSVGLPLANTEVKVVRVDDPNVELGANQEGELAIRGPQVMRGYWNRPEETAKTIVDDGWLLTGDIATIDDDGYTYIVERKKDLIIASGYNVYPREVEEVLYQHPSVLEAAVIGVADEYRGETVKAYLVLRSDAPRVTVEDIQLWCRTHLSAYKIPRIIEFKTELPKTVVGKILRRALRS